MKNLFKKLMLVAVAAMAFAACSQDVNEVNNAVEKVTRYEFTANIADDTRSGFAEKEEGATAYKSEWHDGDQIKVFITDYAGWGAEVTTSISAEGKFALELSGAPESFFMTVVSPAESWASEYTANIPAVQTPLANSVDPKAHLLQAQGVSVDAKTNHIDFAHLAAYGKMTIKGVDFAIDHVVVDLKGSFCGYNRNLSYTINATNVENNTFWFATEPIEVAEFTVTAYDAEGNAVAKTVNVAEAGKTMSFNYGRVGTFSVSGLEVPEEPKALVFTSAKWVNYSTSDKLVQFYTEDGGTLQLNWYNCGSDAWIVPNTYGFASSGAIYYGGEYSWYKNATAGIDAEISNGTVVVSVVAGQYYIEFKNLADWNGTVYIENATFTGLISGLQVPDMRTALAKPTNVQVSVEGRTISVSWGAVEGADGYLFELYSPDNEKFTEIVEGTSFSFTGLNSLWNYYFKLSAYASDENPNYRNSEEIYLEARTEDTDPKMEVSESKIAFSADGGEKTFNVTLKNTDAEITYTQEGDWFSVELSGNTFTVTAEANESETDARDGSITVAAGELSQTVTITQSKKVVQGAGPDGKTLETAYKFTTYTKGSDMGYPVMCLSGSEDGAIFEFESNGTGAYPTGLQTFNSGGWYTNWIKYQVGDTLIHSTYGAEQPSNIDVTKSYTYLTKSGNVYTVEYIKIVLNSGEEIWYTFDGTFTF